MRRSILVIGSLLLAGCNLDVPVPEDHPSDPATEAFAASLNIDIATMQKTALGTYYKDISVGTGATLTSRRPVLVDYAAFLRNGARIDQGLSSPIDLTLGNSITGFGDGMLGMKVGGERVLVIPSALAYGNRNDIPEIPPNSTLIFDVKLTTIP
jgi:FKBP-type peptidyl-prolyl cis-trans isomerase